MQKRSLNFPSFSLRNCTPHIASNRMLREPQRLGCAAIAEHFRQSDSPAIVQIPVGCGKTGLISILPFLVGSGRTLIYAPNLTIRKALFNAVDSGSNACFWRNMGVFGGTPEGPFAAHLDGPEATLSDCLQSHFVVANVQQIGQANNRWLKALPSNFFDLVIFDEGHHNAAATWQRIIEHFCTARVISLTATPFRSDGKSLTGEMVYQYPFLRAMSRGYIKTLQSVQVRPQELAFTMEGEAREVSLAEIMSLREETWFSKGVALADECNRHIVQESVQQQARLRSEGEAHHQIIAAACSVPHAEQIAELYRESGLNALEIHSGQCKTRQAFVMRQLREKKLDVIVQVQMLGEGFDHPSLSVAAIFRPFRTLAPYVQFVGRIMRVIHQQAGGNADNRGVVVSHVGLNTEQHWEQFRELDTGDQSLWSGLVNGCDISEEDRVPPVGEMDIDSAGSEEPRVFAPQMLVNWEVAGDLDLSMYGEAEALGSDRPSDLAGDNHRVSKPVVGPQKRRRQARRQLKQRVDDAIRDVLRESRFSPSGIQVGRRIPSLRRLNNWSAVRYWIYCELNRLLKRKPGKTKLWTLAEIEHAIDLLPQLQYRLSQQLGSGPRASSRQSRGGYAGWRNASNW